jgi:uncharacterized Rmd1/YagE family protein
MYFTPQAVRSFSSNRDGYISSSPVEIRQRQHRQNRAAAEPKMDAANSPIASPGLSTEFSSFSTERPASMPVEGSPAPNNHDPSMPESEAEVEDERIGRVATLKQAAQDDQVAEAVFFSYGVVVFFGLGEAQEKSIIEDIEKAGVPADPISERDWEVEECHFVVSPSLTVEGTWHDDGFFYVARPSYCVSADI